MDWASSMKIQDRIVTAQEKKHTLLRPNRSISGPEIPDPIGTQMVAKLAVNGKREIYFEWRNESLYWSKLWKVYLSKILDPRWLFLFLECYFSSNLQLWWYCKPYSSRIGWQYRGRCNWRVSSNMEVILSYLVRLVVTICWMYIIHTCYMNVLHVTCYIHVTRSHITYMLHACSFSGSYSLVVLNLSR